MVAPFGRRKSARIAAVFVPARALGAGCCGFRAAGFFPGEAAEGSLAAATDVGTDLDSVACSFFTAFSWDRVGRTHSSLWGGDEASPFCAMIGAPFGLRQEVQ